MTKYFLCRASSTQSISSPQTHAKFIFLSETLVFCEFLFNWGVGGTGYRAVTCKPPWQVSAKTAFCSPAWKNSASRGARGGWKNALVLRGSAARNAAPRRAGGRAPKPERWPRRQRCARRRLSQTPSAGELRAAPAAPPPQPLSARGRPWGGGGQKSEK